MKVALVCIAKNEDNYIKEWINYHKKIGFDDIFIYQNDWRTDITESNVYKIEFDGVDKQRKAYNNFILEHKKTYDWAAFFDVDEFIVLKNHKNIKDFISDYINYPAIGINWVLFGNNNNLNLDGNYSVLERFTKRQKQVNQHIKSIVNLSFPVSMDVHNPNCRIIDTNHNSFGGPYNKRGNDNIAQINHYFCKTKDEFIQKCNRGRADSPVFKRTIKEYETLNFNEIDDFSALNFFKNKTT